MTPDDLAARHPRLYHLTDRDALDGIDRHGLLPTSDLLTLFGVHGAARTIVEGERRAAPVILRHAVHGTATISDNSPLSIKALAACLDDGLTPVDWLRLLNARVFFWSDARSLERLAGAKGNRGRDRVALVLDTLSLARAHHATMELCAINAGATIRRAARRGRATFTPLGAYDLKTWRTLRGGKDTIREVTVCGPVTDARQHIVEVRSMSGEGSCAPASAIRRARST